MNWLQTAWEYLTNPKATPNMTLERIIAEESIDVGPLPRTGGVIHRLTTEQVNMVGALIRAASKKWGVPLATLAGWLCVESRFDPNAVNPNNQNATPHDLALDVFFRTDVGIAQIDGRYMDEWPGMHGLPWTAQKERAFDPTWAIDAFAGGAWALLKKYPKPVDAFEVYNVGGSGLNQMIKNGEPETYGLRVQSFIDKFTAAGIH